MDTAPSARQPKPALRPGTEALPWVRVADWTVAVSAGLLLLVSLGGWLCHRTQMADIVADHLRLQVSGPARLRPGLANQYAVTTTSVAGNPVSAQVESALYGPDGVLLAAHNEKTDEEGHLTITIPPELEVAGEKRLEISARHDGREEKVVTRLAVEPVRHATYLTVDKPLYRPGETIGYRALTLSRFHLVPDAELPVEFEIFDPAGAPVAGSQAARVTRRGIACGRFRIPEELPGGKYALVARSDHGAFPPQRRHFFVRRFRLPRLNTRLEFLRTSYAPGETVAADVTVARREDGSAAGARVTVVATVEGEPVHRQSAELSEHGTLHFEFSLPQEIESPDAQLAVTADDGATRETVVKTIPVLLGPVEVSFYPEGGELVTGLETRVYFQARDASGAPVDVRGTLVEDSGRRMVGIATTHRGMGTFSFTPGPGKEYQLELEGLPGGQQAVRLPHATSNGKVVLSSGLSVFHDGRPLEFNVRASERGLPLVAQAWCRGLPVGQRAFITAEAGKANPVAIALDDDVHGVIRLTIYDYRVSPPEPVAERLVYRRPARRLQLQVQTPDPSLSPAEEVELTVSVTNEAGEPLAATLGADLVDHARFALAGRAPGGMAGHFLLATEIDDSRQLDDLDRYLAESPEAGVALDLLLGTQGWRRFLEKSLSGRGEDEEHGPLERLAALGGRAHPPAMFDNLSELQQQYEENLAKYRTKRNWLSDALTALSVLGGVGLLILIAMLSLLNVAGGPRHWATAIAVATVCLLVGGVLVGPGRWQSPPEGAVPYAPFDMAPVDPPPDAQNPAKPKGAEQPTGGDDAGIASTEPIPGVVASDSQGRAQVRFDPAGRPGSYLVVVDGYDGDGRIGATSAPLSTRVPFRLEPILPPQVSPGDRIDLPLAVLNDTDGHLLVELALEHGELVRLEGEATSKLDLEPHERTRRHFPLEVVGQDGACPLRFRGVSDQLADEAACSLQIMPSDIPDGDPIDPALCPVQLSARLEKSEVAWGGTVALQAELANTSDKEQSTTVAVLGLPAGLEVSLDQLELLAATGIIDYYQTRPRQVICYCRSLEPNEQVELKLELIAAIPGRYTGPASSAYLADSPERKQWNEPLAVEITVP